MAKTVTNATAVYAIMIVVFAAGMWAILVVGSTLRAQPDLAGDWTFVPEGDPKQESLRGSLEQSGRFVRLYIGTERHELRITEQDSLATDRRIVMRGTDASAIFEQTPAVDVYRLTLKTPRLDAQRFTARLISRTYPRKGSPRQRAH